MQSVAVDDLLRLDTTSLTSLLCCCLSLLSSVKKSSNSTDKFEGRDESNEVGVNECSSRSSPLEKVPVPSCDGSCEVRYAVIMVVE